MKTIIIDIRSTPNQPGYADRGTVINDADSGILWHGAMSSCPNPVRPSDGEEWRIAYGWCGVAGEYRYECVTTEKHGKCLRLSLPENYEHPERLPTINENHNHDRQPWADDVMVHEGSTGNWRGSAACHTVPPGEWDAFIGWFEIGETGRYIIKGNNQQEVRYGA